MINANLRKRNYNLHFLNTGKMKKKTSITLDNNSYLFQMKHGKRNEYMKKLIKNRLIGLRAMLFFLRSKLGEKEIIELLESMSEPAGQWVTFNISRRQRQALASLWDEMTNTGIKAEDLLDLIKEVNE